MNHPLFITTPTHSHNYHSPHTPSLPRVGRPRLRVNSSIGSLLCDLVGLAFVVWLTPGRLALPAHERLTVAAMVPVTSLLTPHL